MPTALSNLNLILLTYLFAAQCSTAKALDVYPSCSRVFAGQIQPLEHPLTDLEELESNVEQLFMIYTQLYPKSTDHQDQILLVVNQLTNLKIRLNQLIDRALSDRLIFTTDLEPIIEQIELIRTRLHELEYFDNKDKVSLKAEPTLSLDLAIESPLKIVSELAYHYKTVQGFNKKAIFSTQFVKSLKSLNQEALRQVSKSLSKLPYGIFGGGYRGVGVIQLDNLNIFEVRIVGGSLNRLRLLGYIDSDELHFILYSLNEHSEAEMARLSRVIHSARRNRQNHEHSQ
jgi:mRNA-degrading endonuclease RelE of RelBE toxin-antitoxin system